MASAIRQLTMKIRIAASAVTVMALLLGGLFFFQSKNEPIPKQKESASGSTKSLIPESENIPKVSTDASSTDDFEIVDHELKPTETAQLDFILKKYQKESSKFTYLKDGHVQFEEGAEIRINERHSVSSESGLFFSTPDLRCFYGDLKVTDEAGSSILATAILIDSKGDFLLRVDENVPLSDLYQKLLDNPTLSVRELANPSE